MAQEDESVPARACLFCDAPCGEAEFFICGPVYSGICGECVGYLMSVTACDEFALFEQYVERARRFGENNAEVRRRESLSPQSLKN